MSGEAALLGVDWGSTSLRAFRIAAGGAILETRRAADGVFAGSGPFEARLRAHLGDWLARDPDAPILLCGMIGSDRGWRPAPYVPAPAGLTQIAAARVAVPFERSAHIVPGISLIDGETCEVMRGEETLLLGLGAATATVCLPGTHSKWAYITDGHIARFRTYMTGELRAALLSQGALATGIEQVPSPGAFAAGLRAAADGVTAALFQARARRLLGQLAAGHTGAFVEGVLIGEELAREPANPLHLIANGAIARSYSAALEAQGRAVTRIDPEPLAAKGLYAIARAAGLV
jgi:2-dehydro-3-deoxygalactonokinase